MKLHTGPQVNLVIWFLVSVILALMLLPVHMIASIALLFPIRPNAKIYYWEWHLESRARGFTRRITGLW